MRAQVARYLWTKPQSSNGTTLASMASRFSFLTLYTTPEPEKEYKGFIYMPDPLTKVDHIQDKSILELIMPKIPGLAYGMKACIEVEDEQLQFFRP